MLLLLYFRHCCQPLPLFRLFSDYLMLQLPTPADAMPRHYYFAFATFIIYSDADADYYMIIAFAAAAAIIKMMRYMPRCAIPAD